MVVKPILKEIGYNNEEEYGGQLLLINKFIIVFSWYSITANMAQQSQRGK